MRYRLAIDRFDGLHKELAVLLTEDGRSFVFPRDLLPPGAKAGELLSIAIDRDPKATMDVKRQAKDLREQLDQTDPGGDISL